MDTSKYYRKIVLHDERPVSWNKFYSGKHWRVRAREAERVHQLVRSAIDPGEDTFLLPVHIAITVYFDQRPYDACNIPAKLYIDGLKNWWLLDDDMRYVRSVTTIPKLDRDHPRVVIEASTGAMVQFQEGEQT